MLSPVEVKDGEQKEVHAQIQQEPVIGPHGRGRLHGGSIAIAAALWSKARLKVLFVDLICCERKIIVPSLGMPAAPCTVYIAATRWQRDRH